MCIGDVNTWLEKWKEKKKDGEILIFTSHSNLKKGDGEIDDSSIGNP